MKKLVKNLTYKKLNLKSRIENILMKGGNKSTVEKSLIKSLKILQKNSNKQHKDLIKLAIINSTPSLKVNKTTLKKGRKKTTKISAEFIKTNSLRNNLAIKGLKNSAEKHKFKHFADKFAKELIDSSKLEGYSIEKNAEIQKQALLNKRYLFKYKW